MTILVLIEGEAGTVKQPSRSALAAAARLGGNVHGLVVGSRADAEAAARLPGLSEVLHAELAHILAEPVADLIVGLAGDYSHVLAAATASGKNILPRAAALLDVQPISDVTEVMDAETFVRPIYAGNALARVRSADAKKLLTIRAASFDPVPATGGAAPIRAVHIAESAGSAFVSAEIAHSERPELTAARIIVSGGRGMANAENFHLLDKLADKLGAAVGASRAAVDAGYAPNDFQVGQTGKIVAPELYIAIGISGAIQHLAGMKDSKVIVAINKDPDAPIFQVADYGLVADLFTAVPALDEALANAP